MKLAETKKLKLQNVNCIQLLTLYINNIQDSDNDLATSWKNQPLSVIYEKENLHSNHGIIIGADAHTVLLIADKNNKINQIDNQKIKNQTISSTNTKNYQIRLYKVTSIQEIRFHPAIIITDYSPHILMVLMKDHQLDKNNSRNRYSRSNSKNDLYRNIIPDQTLLEVTTRIKLEIDTILTAEYPIVHTNAIGSIRTIVVDTSTTIDHRIILLTNAIRNRYHSNGRIPNWPNTIQLK